MQYQHRCDDCEAGIEPLAEVFILIEDDEGENDSVYGFEIVGKVDGECREAFECIG